MKSNELIQGKWYTCKQWNKPNVIFQFNKKVGDVVHGSVYVAKTIHPPQKMKFTPYYYYEFTEVEIPSEVVKPTPKRKRYERKKVEELLSKLANDLFGAFTEESTFTTFEQWKQDNL